MTQRPKVLLIVFGFAAITGIAAAQYGGSYAEYYQRNVKNYRAPDPGTSRFLYDKYYYHNPNVSPYLSAIRGGSSSSTAYYTSVLPEQRRRKAAIQAQMTYAQQRKRQGNVGYTAYPGANFVGATPADALKKPPQKQPYKPNAYYNRLYGNRYMK